MTTQSSSNTKWGHPRALVEPVFPTPGTHLGGYTLLNQLEHHPIAERWLARPEHPGADRDRDPRVLLYRVTLPTARDAQPAALDHPHIQRACETTIRSGAGRWFVSANPGRWGRIFTLAQITRSRETGWFRPTEAALVAQHLLGASAHAHDAGVCHGPITAEEIIITANGSARIELYALARRLRSEQEFDEVAALHEIASIAQLARTLAPADQHARYAKPLHRWSEQTERACEADTIDARGALDALIDAMNLPA